MSAIRLSLLFACALVLPVRGQLPTIQGLDPEARFPTGFSRISGIRQLSEGSLLISDGLEQALFRVNLASHAVERLGRNGGGPGEYRRPAGLLALGGDTTMLVDLGNFRLMRIAPDGRLGTSYSMMAGDHLRMATAGDGLGRLYWNQPPFDFGRGQRRTNGARPITIFRWDPSTDIVDSVASIAVTGGLGGAGGLPFVMPFQGADAWAVAPDGRIAIVHHHPYRVEWIQPDGRHIEGAEVRYEPVPIRRADQEAWADVQATRTATMLLEGGGSQSQRSRRPDLSRIDFPAVFPPFPADGASISHEGEIWVERHRSVTAEGGSVFDVFDGRGTLVKRFQLPVSRTLVGFGPRTVYAYFTDQEDFQWLEVFPVP